MPNASRYLVLASVMSGVGPQVILERQRLTTDKCLDSWCMERFLACFFAP